MSHRDSVLLLVAGAKGAVGSTVAAAVAALRQDPVRVLPSLMTGQMFSHLLSCEEMAFAGWDVRPGSMTAAVRHHGVLPDTLWKTHEEFLDRLPVCQGPSVELGLRAQVEGLSRDIERFRSAYPGARPVLVNLLPACAPVDLDRFHSLEDLFSQTGVSAFPDLAYAVAAVVSGTPVVNFTPNVVEIPVVVHEAVLRGVPVTGRDGKTGQTYLKVVLASALKARHLPVDGWYSVNILGNEDGKNLEDPRRAAGKVANKTEVLDEVLGYRVGDRYGVPTHTVHIGYYPPRGDAKEAWDVVDFLGLFGMPMSLRLNLLARDSILAAPLVLDLARWMVALQMGGRCGLIPELAFYFKRPLGENAPVTFEDQIGTLDDLKRTLEH